MNDEGTHERQEVKDEGIHERQEVEIEIYAITLDDDFHDRDLGLESGPAGEPGKKNPPPRRRRRTQGP
jgi:hypothetical protein